VKRAVVVDDDRRTRRILQIVLERVGLESAAFEGPEPALELLRSESVAIVLTDLRMPRMNGIEFMRALRELDHDVPVIVLTAYGTVEAAVEAMKLGAVDFLAKPFDVDALEILIRRSLESQRQRSENLFLREQAGPPRGLEDIIGASPAMREVFELIRKSAPASSAVLITGETGTGKELVARALHKLSPRHDKLFVPINCSAIPGELLESELFGHVRGAFSGADANRPGRFQAADGGTLFLDEIGDMALGLQAKLLRVLQEGVIEPLGSNRRVPVDVRIVSATHRDLREAMASGQFRDDLFYRLDVIHIELPPLRERREDIPALAASFLESFGAELGKGSLGLSESATQLLRSLPWRGNVRELRNAMERAAVLCETQVIEARDLERMLPASVEERTTPPASTLAEALDETERREILRALAQTDDNKVAAAALLGIGERTLWTKLKKHGL